MSIMAKEIDGFSKVALAAANTRLALTTAYRQIERLIERLPMLDEEHLFRGLVEVLDTLDEPRTGDHVPSAHSFYGKSMEEERRRKNSKNSTEWYREHRSPEQKLSAEIRQWARENGHVVSDVGVIPRKIREAFYRAHNMDDIAKEVGRA